MDLTNGRLQRAYQVTLAALLAERNADGYWTGELSTSALSTATAVAALSLVRRSTAKTEPAAPARQSLACAAGSDKGSQTTLIQNGLAWLAAHQNPDGGWGDTVISFSNISTTMLCRAAFHLADAAAKYRDVLHRAEDWLGERYGRTPAEQAGGGAGPLWQGSHFRGADPDDLRLAGLTSWQEVPPLPFELACFPQSWFRFLKLQVVSYALPALIAIGQAVYHHRPPWNPIARAFAGWPGGEVSRYSKRSNLPAAVF